MNKYFYFGYGMNTNQASMKLRCPNARVLGSAALYDWEFRFAYHADVLPKSGEKTVGVLWEITDECLTSLDALEGYPTYYDRKLVKVIHHNKEYESLVYYMTPGEVECPPPESYWRMLHEGYGEHNVSKRQLWTAIKRSYDYKDLSLEQVS
jgi:gamma-glutamylcyclotransferase (GGCT)/AIG2-like uncharacterized protein YtfP